MPASILRLQRVSATLCCSGPFRCVPAFLFGGGGGVHVHSILVDGSNPAKLAERCAINAAPHTAPSDVQVEDPFQDLVGCT